MNDAKFIIRYSLGDSFLEKLAGKTKVLLFFSSIILMMASFDLRIILPLFILNFLFFKSVYQEIKILKFIIIFTLVMNILNFILFYLVNPTTGTELSQTFTLLFKFNDYYVITYETVIYFITRIFKIIGTLMISLWFILSITPSELASGIYGCKIPYKYATMVSLGLRYIPDIYRDFNAIKESMQMRGIELDPKKASLFKRIIANTKILIPLLLVSFERIELIASAMDLRGYGQLDERSYYSDKDLTKTDQKVIYFAYFQLLCAVVYIVLNMFNVVPKLWVL